MNKRKIISLSLAMLLMIGLFSTMALASESDLGASSSSVPIAPFRLNPPGIAFTVKDFTSDATLIQAGMYAPTSQPPYNLVRITDRGFDLDRWAGWRVRNWSSSYIFGIPPSPSEEPVVLRMSTGSTQPPPIPYETIPEIPNTSGLLESNFEWLAHPTFIVFVEPIPPNIVKTLETESPIYPGDIVSFSITVTNPAVLPNHWGQIAFPGPPPFPEALGSPIPTTPFDGFKVIDDLEAAGLILVEDSITIAGEREVIDNQSCQTDNILDITLDLPHATDANNPGVITIKYQAWVPTTAIPGVSITNTAKLIDSDGNLVDDSSVTKEIEPPPIPPVPKIKIEKSVSQTNVEQGTDITYTLVTTNTGEETLKDVVVTDTLDDLLTNPRNENTTHGTCSFTGQTLTANIGTLKPEEYATITFVVTVDKNAEYGINIPNIAYTSGEGETSGITVTDEDPIDIKVPEFTHQEENDEKDENDDKNDDKKDEKDDGEKNDEKNEDTGGSTPGTGDNLLIRILGYAVALVLSAASIFYIRSRLLNSLT